MPQLTLAAVRGEAGLHIQVRLVEPMAGGALLLSVTGTAGQLLAQERLLLPERTGALDHLVATTDAPLRVKVVLLAGDEVIAQQRVDLHISLAAFES